ncbi:MAG: class I SAM-dependent methyltransferase [Methylobacteriaceae bacterium]|nr:class I SAM-dependent methyltransferase [Methylobacteriaceae bacterium]
MDRLLQAFLWRFFRRGNLEVETASGARLRAGDGTGTPVAIKVRDKAAQWRLLLNPQLAVGELFMDGRLEVTRGTIYDFLALGMTAIASGNHPRFLDHLEHARTWIRRFHQLNNPRRAKRNVHHHYDLDGRLYALFLDADRQYSCAYFEHQGQSLDDAQLAKKRHIAAKLLVEPGARVLDIGCGWGGMALYLAERCGAHVLGVTLSQEQLAEARGRAVERRLNDRVTFRLQDYRAIEERFDRIVSVGMFEHVGVAYYDAFFKQAAKLLSDDGVMLLHSIGRTDGPGATNPWIQKYIFPGGYIPALSEVLPAIQRAGLIVTDVEVLRLHYAETLRHWRERFMARREEAKALFDERFCRMWEFYLAASEGSFRFHSQNVFQIQLVKRQDAVPLTRDYIAKREAALRQADAEVVRLRLAGE